MDCHHEATECEQVLDFIFSGFRGDIGNIKTKVHHDEVKEKHGFIKVTNIAPDATEKEIKDLFAFCGFVMAVYLKKENDEHQSAIVQFYDKDSVTTAVLLNNAIIRDQAIKSELHYPSAEEMSHLIQNQPSSDQLPNQDSKSGIIAKVLASGYVIGKDAADKALAWDKGHLSIAEKLEALGKSAIASAQSVIESFGWGEKTTDALSAAGSKAVEIKDKVVENPNVQVVKQKAEEIDSQFAISSTAKNIVSTVTEQVSNIASSTQKEIEKQQAEAEQIEKMSANKP